jgi:hypothetical protein
MRGDRVPRVANPRRAATRELRGRVADPETSQQAVSDGSEGGWLPLGGRLNEAFATFRSDACGSRRRGVPEAIRWPEGHPAATPVYEGAPSRFAGLSGSSRFSCPRTRLKARGRVSRWVGAFVSSLRDELSMTNRHPIALGRAAEAAREHRGVHDKPRSDERNEQHRACGEATAPKVHSRISRHFFLRIVRYSLRSWHEIQAA